LQKELFDFNTLLLNAGTQMDKLEKKVKAMCKEYKEDKERKESRKANNNLL
jgi:hypothetical protein